jgi:hypothetical protein
MARRLTREQRNELLTARRLAEAIEVVVNEMPQGAPAGPMYAALMPWVSLEQFQMCLNVLVQAGRIRRRRNVYYPARRAAS